MKKLVFGFIATIGAIIFAISVFLTLAILCFGIFVYKDIWYFPGDPPIIDVAVFPAAISFLLGLGYIALGRSRHPYNLTPLVWAGAFRIGTTLSLLALALCAAGIGFRHTSRWSELRKGIRYYGDTIAIAAGNKNRVLSTAEFEYYRNMILPSPVKVVLPGYGDVWLTMAHGIYPYVGVNFGQGQNALFDPGTMICTYSD